MHILLFVILFFITPSLGASILFDDAHDTDDDELNGILSDFASLLSSNGITIVEFDGSPGSLTPSVLADHEALFIIDTELAYTSTEILAIGSFVASGHGLFINGNAPANFNQSSNNALMSQFGITFNEALSASNQDTVSFANHPLVQGLTRLVGDGVGRVSVSGTSQLIGFNDLGQGTIAVREPVDGSGWVVAMGDGAPLLNQFLNQADDATWALRAASEVVPEPASLSLFGLLLAGVSTRLRRRQQNCQG